MISDLAKQVFDSKYALTYKKLNTDSNELESFKETKPENMFNRLTDEFHRIEKSKFKEPMSREQIYNLFNDFKYLIGGGSVLYGVGNNNQYISLSNCFVVETPLDSYGGIIHTDGQLVNISKRRGGVGLCLDNLRPKGSVTRNASHTSTGIIPFMERFSNTINEVGQCLKKGSLILVKDKGLTPIELVTDEDKVWTKNGWIKNSKTLANGKKKCYRLVTNRGYSVTSSKDHIFQTFNDDGELTETALNNLNIGDPIVLSIGEHIDKEYITLNNNNYKNTNNKPDNCVLPDILDENLAYLIGFSYGDGNVIYNSVKEKIGLSLAVETKRPSIKNKLIDITKSIFSYDIKVRAGAGQVELLSIHNRVITEFLKDNELLKQKAGHLIFPEKIMYSNSLVQAAFLAGYFDADGYASGSKKGYSFSSIDKIFLEKCQILLSAMGIISKLSFEDRQNKGWNDLYNLNITGTSSQRILLEKLSESIKIKECNFLSKRDSNLTPFKSKSFNIKHYKYNYCPDNSNFLSRETINKLSITEPAVNKYLIQDTVKYIEEVGEYDTYDLKLEEEHLFWCNGLYVHNSGRRGAEMQLISVHHPEIVSFINAKLEEGKISGANISVKLTNEFLRAVEDDKEYELRFPVSDLLDNKGKVMTKAGSKYSEMVRAKDIWNKIIYAAWFRAEPGLLFWDNILNNGPAECYPSYRSVSTNPCSELPLPELDSCRLMAMNLFSFVVNPFTKDAYFDYDLYKQMVYRSQRIMDNLVDLESEKIDKIINKIKSDPEPDYIKQPELDMWKKIKVKNDEGRRSGLGILGLGDTLAALGIEYGSELSIKIAGDISRTHKLAAYRSSVDMAKELGSFKDYDYKLELDNPFIMRIKEEAPELYKDMVKYGRRNIACTTIAPTGSISILAGTTSGIEPLYMQSYTRRRKLSSDVTEFDFIDVEGTKWKNYEVFHPKVKLWMDITGESDVNKSPYSNCTADKIDWINRVKIQGEIQNHICSSISSTINLPSDVTKEKVAEIYTYAWKYNLKGITVYRDGCRAGVLVDSNSNNLVNNIGNRDAKKRPKELECEIYHTNVTKKLDKVRTFRYMVMIGLLDGEPYEIFAIENGKHKDTEGKLIRVKRGHYNLQLANETIENITKDTTETEDALTRIVSTSLRHGVPIHYISEQLNKVQGELFCFSKSLARSLKKFIKNGTNSSEDCPKCNNKLIYENGCYICKNCGESKCS